MDFTPRRQEGEGMSKPNPRPLSRKARRCAVDHPSTTGDVSKSGHLHSQFSWKLPCSREDVAKLRRRESAGSSWLPGSTRCCSPIWLATKPSSTEGPLRPDPDLLCSQRPAGFKEDGSLVSKESSSPAHDSTVDDACLMGAILDWLQHEPWRRSLRRFESDG